MIVVPMVIVYVVPIAGGEDAAVVSPQVYGVSPAICGMLVLAIGSVGHVVAVMQGPT